MIEHVGAEDVAVVPKIPWWKFGWQDVAFQLPLYPLGNNVTTSIDRMNIRR